ncbi:hypothetical protein R1sor_024007 [Riccia sorocarpa]|uniref:Uncharacterized protein n=1 Tax=Riccia sorocarpa TaxID=122646 RepID=A0ABD3GQT6_9MARC
MDSIILPLDHDFSAFHVLLPLQISATTFPKGEEFLRNAKLECNEELRLILRGVENVVQERLNQSVDVQAFVLELKDVLLDAVGWEHLVWLADDLSSLHLRIFDSAGREHIILIDLPPGFPEMQPTASTLSNLPVLVDLRSLHGGSLKDIVSQYETAIEKYQDFWKVMEDVDRRVWVMEPDHPSRAVILFGASLLVVIAPCPYWWILFHPDLCRFFGSDAVISPLRKRMNSGLRKWDQTRLLIANLEEVLELTFPSAQDTGNEDMSAD